MRMVERKWLMAVLALVVLVGGSWSGRAVGGDVAHGKALASTGCAACHGADGNSGNADYPRLAGLDADYLYQQLVAFRSGTRSSMLMTSTVTALSDEDMRDLSSYYAAQTRAHDAPASADLMALGRRIFMDGANDGSVAACASCHASGEAGMGHMGHMGGGMHMGHMMGGMTSRPAPSLYGQHAAYLVSQLQAFSDGSRPGPVMEPIAHALTEAQARAVAAYLAAQP